MYSVQCNTSSRQTCVAGSKPDPDNMLLLLLISTLALVAGDVSHILHQEEHTEPPPPKPYAFTYTAGRYPGHADRQHTEVSDGSGVIRGQYSYIDPRQKIRTVQYVADKQGFHPILNDAPEDHPRDSEAVARAKDRHYQLYNKIAESHQQHPYAKDSVPRQSAAVALETAKHAQLFKVIAEQHARIAAEREALQHEEEEEKLHLQDLHHAQY